MTTLKEEEPYAAVVGSENISRTCSKCFAWNTEDLERVKLNRCAGCHVLCYCSTKCQKGDWKDHKAECKLLRSADFVPIVEARLVLRMLEKSKKHPDIKSFNGRTYHSLDHFSLMRCHNARCRAEAKKIYDDICRFMGPEDPDYEMAFLAIHKMAMNKFKLLDGSWACESRGIGVYLGLSVLNHSCRPNAFIVNQGSKMMLRTTNKDLVYSDNLTISYCNELPFMDTHMRSDKLYANYSFMCNCVECLDSKSDQKKTSGRPACCPTSWFSVTDRICNNCKKEVSFDLADTARGAMKALRGAVDMFSKLQNEGSALSGVIDYCIELYDSSKEVLSDENFYLFAIMNMISLHVPLARMNVACKFADLCASYVRKNPYCVYSTILFSRRQHVYEMAQKPPQEMKQALIEAVDSAQMVFGTEHEFTQMLQKTLYDIENLNTRKIASDRTSCVII